MNTVHRRTEIINILIIRRHTTANELAQEFGVSIRTIQYDIQALTPVYPIYTKQGENGGIFIREDYKPYANSLTPMEVAALAELDKITYRAMMGEYIIYYRGKIVGGIYDDRLLVKPIKSAISYMPTATYELPYDGAKEMLLVEDVDNKKFLTGLFNAMYDELPAPKPKKKK